MLFWLLIPLPELSNFRDSDLLDEGKSECPHGMPMQHCYKKSVLQVCFLAFLKRAKTFGLDDFILGKGKYPHFGKGILDTGSEIV